METCGSVYAQGLRMVKLLRLKFFFSLCLGCLSTASLISSACAQQVQHAAIGDAAKQKQLLARFLAERGVGAPSSNIRLTQNGAAMLATARARHRAMLATRNSLAQDTPGGAASLTAQWQPVGSGQIVTPAYGAITGRITSVAVDPSDTSGNTVYIGSTGGGVWKSTNAAGSPSSVTFAPLTDTLGVYSATDSVSLSIGALTVQPGGTGVVLAGTGDPNDASDSYYGAGILRSVNGGLTWNLISQTSDTSAGTHEFFTFTGSSFAGFAWSTTTSGLVVAAVTSSAEGQEANAGITASAIMGLYYSQDAGQTWNMASISDGTGSPVQSDQTLFTTRGSAATSVVWNPIRQLFFAAVRYHGYYQSPDGINWTRMTSQPGANFTTQNCPSLPGLPGSPGCPIFRGALAVQPVTGDLFALSVDQNNLDQGLWQDTCNTISGACSSPTVSFAQINDTALEAGNANSGINPLTISQADYDLYLAAIPSQQDTLLFAGTVDIYRCSLANACAWLNTTNSKTFAAAQVAPAQHAIGGTGCLLYFGNDGGLWRSTNAVGQPSSICSASDGNDFDNLNAGFQGSLAEVESLAVDANNQQNMMASLGLLGTAALTTTSTTWTQVLDGEGNYAAIDPTPNQSPGAQNWYTTSLSTPNLAINLCTEGSACDETGFDAGNPIIGATQVEGDQQSIPAPWILDPQDASKIILGTCRVWHAPATGGASWSSSSIVGGNNYAGMLDENNANPFCEGNAEIRSIAASGTSADAPGTPQRIYAGIAGQLDGGAGLPGHLFTTTVTGQPGDAAAVWTDLYHSSVSNGFSASSQFNPGGFDISSVVVDTHDPTGNTVYATIQGFGGNGINAAHVYASADGGADWVNISGSLPNAPANSVLVDPNNANTVYVAMDTGVYVNTNVLSCINADNYTCNWSVFGTLLPNAPPVQLAAFNEGSTSVLRVATYGRGVWEVPLLSAGTTFTTATANPTSLTFLTQQESTTSPAQTVTITNTGRFTLNVTQITLTGDFSENDTCNIPIDPGDSCQVNVSFTPTAIGPRTGTLTVFGNLTGGGQVAVPLNGTGAPGAAITLTPGSLSFAETLIGQTAAVQNIAVSNTGGVPATLASEAVTGNFAITANTCTGVLAANSGCTLSIAFTPTAAGPRTGTLTVIDSVGKQTAQLSGAGQAPATDALAPTSLSFPAQVVGTLSQPLQVTLTNSGDQALTLISAQSTADFPVVNGCGASLAGHSSCAISVSFAPTKIGAESGVLTVGDVLRTQTVAVSGTGLAPAGVSATPNVINFGNYAVGGTSQPQVVTLTNNGDVPLSGLGTSLTGDFTVQAAASSCSATLAPHSNCQIAVVFSPSQAGARLGQLTVTATGIANALQVSLSGNGEDFQLVVSGASSQTMTSGQTATYQVQVVPVSNSTGSVTLSCSGAPANATCNLNPASVTLSGTGTASVTVTIATGVSTANASSTMLRALPPIMLAMLAPVLWIPKRLRKPWLAILALLLLPLAPMGCGLGVKASSGTGTGTGTGTGPTGPTNPTPSGSYTVVVTGTAPGLSHTVSLTLNVE